jgi:sialidase-1
LADGALLYSISQFSTGPGDHATAHIVAAKSYDGGRKWLDPFDLQEKMGSLNVMSSTLRRLGDLSKGDSSLGHFFLVKNSLQDLQCYLRISHDEGETFGDPIAVSLSLGYNVMNNDRVLKLSSGRLIAPIASTPDVENINHFVSYCTFSDDVGLTWRESENRVDYLRRGAMEPEIVEFKDSRLGMIIRTQLGHLAISYSEDQGNSWSESASWNVRSCESPATCRRIPSTGDLLLIWNDNYEPGADHEGLRIPLTAAISKDDGRTWEHKRNLETGPGKTAAYASLTFMNDRAILTYTVRSDETKLRSHRFRSLPISWFYEN